ncbi:MAG: kelch repeat-containing protein, partial [Anaerolineae bacterium]
MAHPNMTRGRYIRLLTAVVGLAALVVLLLATTTEALPLAAAIRNWTTATPLPEALDSAAAVTVGDWLYVLGGLHGEQ